MSYRSIIRNRIGENFAVRLVIKNSGVEFRVFTVIENECYGIFVCSPLCKELGVSSYRISIKVPCVRAFRFLIPAAECISGRVGRICRCGNLGVIPKICILVARRHNNFVMTICIEGHIIVFIFVVNIDYYIAVHRNAVDCERGISISLFFASRVIVLNISNLVSGYRVIISIESI